MRCSHRGGSGVLAWLAAAAIGWGAAFPAASAGAKEPDGTKKGNTCVDCHRRKETVQKFPPWAQDHFVIWYVGAHGRADVACQECHGGDPAASGKAASHADLRSSSDPLSAIYYKNLPQTCGKCHEQVYEEFVRSDHYKALVADRLSPTCTTCHGLHMDVTGATPSLVERCTLCHNAEVGVKPEVAEKARGVLGHLAETQQAIERARLTIELARGEGRDLARAEEQLRNAQERLDQTGSHWHRFRLRAFDRELTGIRATAEKAQATAMRAIMSP